MMASSWQKLVCCQASAGAERIGKSSGQSKKLMMKTIKLQFTNLYCHLIQSCIMVVFAELKKYTETEICH